MTSKKKNQSPATQENTEQTVEQKKKVSKVEILSPVSEIQSLFKKINEITEKLPECSFKKSLQTSNKNYGKKLDNFLKNTGDIFAVSEDEKSIIERLRKGEIAIKEREF